MNEIISPLSAPVDAEVEAATARIRNRLSRLVPDIVDTGRDLQEVKSKLEHGQFEGWLKREFDMDVRTAQRFMRVAKWAEGKNDIVSHLTPSTIYLLSAPSTPQAIQEKVVDAIKSDKTPKHAEIDRMVWEAKEQEREEKKRQAKTPEQRKKNWEREKRRTKTREREERKRQEEFRKKQDAATATAREVADILVSELSKDEVDKIYEVLDDWDVTFTMLCKAIDEARRAPSDNVTAVPLKPSGSKS